jgi:hypothetical protein
MAPANVRSRSHLSFTASRSRCYLVPSIMCYAPQAAEPEHTEHSAALLLRREDEKGGVDLLRVASATAGAVARNGPRLKPTSTWKVSSTFALSTDAHEVRPPRRRCSCAATAIALTPASCRHLLKAVSIRAAGAAHWQAVAALSVWRGSRSVVARAAAPEGRPVLWCPALSCSRSTRRVCRSDGSRG